MQLRLLSIGNSFSIDSMKYMGYIAQDLGFTQLVLGNLFVPGCSIDRHWDQLSQQLPSYRYYVFDGSDWVITPDFCSEDAIKAEKWDYISIQHGTGDGSRYSKPESYGNLPRLIRRVRELAHSDVKICFNMTWVGDENKPRSEMPEYTDRLPDLYRDIADLTRELVAPMVDKVCPTGTAIQLVRQQVAELLTRDGYHLSYGLGRYTAAMAFLKALTGCDLEKLRWMPEGVTDEMRQLAIQAANQAVKNPYNE